MCFSQDQTNDVFKLKNILSSIWRENIKEAFSRGIISTESTLVAELYYHLKNKTQYNIWLEHNFIDNKYRFDIAVTNSKEIIGIIEVKFNPNGKSYYEHDIEKLMEINRVNDRKEFLLLDPNSGDWDYTKSFMINSNLLTVFIVVDNYRSKAIKSEKWEQNLNDLNFLHLIGSIGDNGFKFN